MRNRVMRREPGKSASRALLAIAFSAFMAFNSCVPAAMPAYQTQQYPDFNEKTLIVNKKTNETSFIKMLREKGATNIICSKGYVNGMVVSAVLADFMDYIYLFKEGIYIGRIGIKHDEGKPQVHPFIKIVYTKNALGIFLVADNMEYKGKRVAQLMLIKKGGDLTYKSMSLQEMITKHGGMYDPYIGGENLETGVFLAGRMNTGEAWPSVYKIRLIGEELTLDMVPASEAAGCSCYSDWMMGKDAREVFGMKVE